MVKHPDPRKSGQAIIFLMVVMVIGLLAVVWNFDLHRVVSAKLRMRNAGDAAALAGARWQGHTLNMIGDLNLIQAAIMSMSYDEDPQTGAIEFFMPPEAYELHELRQRLDFVGPLGAFAIAQQTAFNNGALPDPELAANLIEFAGWLRDEISLEPYPEAFDEYADVLVDLATRGVAVSSYGIANLPRRHPLVQEGFYAAIAEALVGWWCPMRNYEYELEDYEDFESWGKLNTDDFRYRFMFDLQLEEFSTVSADGTLEMPDTAVPDEDDFLEELRDYMETTTIIEDYAESAGYAVAAMYSVPEAEWHVYSTRSWQQRWPRPAEYGDDVTYHNLNKRLAIRDRVKAKYNYLGAVAGISMSAKVGRGILSSSDNETVDLSYKAKAKPFGFLNLEDGQEPPYYFGFVFPCFQNVRLVHSDIGERAMSGVFYEHVTAHLESYLERGPTSTDPDCPYCRLLVKWEDLDRKEGLDWLDRAYNDENDNPCDPEVDGDMPWGDDGGGATGGS